jgi:mycothiol synthase
METTKMSTNIGQEVSMPGAPQISGLRFRPFDIGRDIPALAELIAHAHKADRVDWIPTAEALRNDLAHHADFEPARDMLVAEIDGTMAGAAQQMPRVRAGVVHHHLAAWVSPDRRGLGIGHALLQWMEARSRAAAATWEGSEPHAFTNWVDETQTEAIELLQSEGYGRVRYGFMMVRPLSEPIPDAPLPDGLEIRPVVESDHRRIWDADVEAFQDHWDAAVRTEEDFVAWYATPGIDTSLWRVAWDGDEVAGSVMNFIWPEENETLGVARGWLEHISVRRPWRRRGLAAALIVDSLRALRARGLTEGALGVDAENPTGALRLYESLGFRRHQTGIAFRKEF